MRGPSPLSLPHGLYTGLLPRGLRCGNTRGRLAEGARAIDLVDGKIVVSAKARERGPEEAEEFGEAPEDTSEA